MAVDQARFVPRNSYGGYLCQVLVVRSNNRNDPERCSIYLHNPKGNEYPPSVEDLELLLGVEYENTKELPIWIGNVLIEGSRAPEYEIQLKRHGKILGFSEAVSYFEKFTTLKRL